MKTRSVVADDMNSAITRRAEAALEALAFQQRECVRFNGGLRCV